MSIRRRPWLRCVAPALAVALATPSAVYAADPPPPISAEAPPSASAETRPGRPGRPMTIAGSVFIMASAGGYIAMAVGLGMGNNADNEVRSLGAAEDLERRREVMDRGELGNRLAIGAGVSAAVLMATGIALVVVGRRKSDVPRVSAGPLPLQRGAGLQLGARF